MVCDMFPQCKEQLKIQISNRMFWMSVSVILTQNENQIDKGSLQYM